MKFEYIYSHQNSDITKRLYSPAHWSSKFLTRIRERSKRLAAEPPACHPDAAAAAVAAALENAPSLKIVFAIRPAAAAAAAVASLNRIMRIRVPHPARCGQLKI